MPRALAKSTMANGRKRNKPAKTASRATVPRQIDRGILDGFIAFNLRQAQDAAFRAFVHHSAQRDFKPGRFAVLMLLHYNPGLSQTDLCREIARDKSTVTPLIQDLLGRGLIERRRSETDRRIAALTLTATGKTHLSALLEDVCEHDRRLDKIIGTDKPRLLALLKMIAEHAG